MVSFTKYIATAGLIAGLILPVPAWATNRETFRNLKKGNPKSVCQLRGSGTTAKPPVGTKAYLGILNNKRTANITELYAWVSGVERDERDLLGTCVIAAGQGLTITFDDEPECAIAATCHIDLYVRFNIGPPVFNTGIDVRQVHVWQFSDMPDIP